MLGQGGMGAVFAARHLALDERVAIKILGPAAIGNQEALTRLQREARILARVRNEHVVRVIDLGNLEDGAPFMVMELLNGRDLGSLLQEQGRFAVEDAVGYILQALVALAAAHTNGVVHRDLKPDNLFCTPGQDGAWAIKVLDFGISRLERLNQGSDSSSMTGPSAVMGTPLYMSPEQLRDSSAVDARSDIWSIGVVLYELVTGVMPFSGASLADILVKITTEPPSPPGMLNPSLAPGFESVLLRCLRKDRDERFANVAELARALQPFGPAGCGPLVDRVVRLAAESPIQISSDDKGGMPSVEPVAAPTPSSTPGGVPAPLTPAPAARRPTTMQLVLALVALLALVVAWRLTALRGRTSAVTPAGVGLVEQALPDKTSGGAPPIPAVASESDLPIMNDPPAAAAHSGDLMKDPRVAPSTHSGPALKSLCNPPYTIDPQGRKKFRHECFTEPTIR